MKFRTLRRLLAVVVLSTFFFGLSAPLASASMEWCPYLKFDGRRYEICIPIP